MTDLTKDQARTVRDRLRTIAKLYDELEKARHDLLFVDGFYNPDLLPIEKEVLTNLNQWGSGSGRIVLAMLDQAFNDIIAYRPNANLDPAERDHETRWEAWDKQDWKQEKAEAAQHLLTGPLSETREKVHPKRVRTADGWAPAYINTWEPTR